MEDNRIPEVIRQILTERLDRVDKDINWHNEEIEKYQEYLDKEIVRLRTAEDERIAIAKFLGVVF